MLCFLSFNSKESSRSSSCSSSYYYVLAVSRRMTSAHTAGEAGPQAPGEVTHATPLEAKWGRPSALLLGGGFCWNIFKMKTITRILKRHSGCSGCISTNMMDLMCLHVPLRALHQRDQLTGSWYSRAMAVNLYLLKDSSTTPTVRTVVLCGGVSKSYCPRNLQATRFLNRTLENNLHSGNESNIHNKGMPAPV